MKQRQMDLFTEYNRTKQDTVNFKEALMSGQLAGMVKEAVKGEKVSSPEKAHAGGICGWLRPAALCFRGSARIGIYIRV